MKKTHFQKDLTSLVNNVPETWKELKTFLDTAVAETAELHFPKNTNAKDNLEDTMKLIFRLKNRLD